MTREKYKLKTDKKAFYYPKDFQKMLDIATEKQKYNLLCLINTGARINEMRNVDAQDLDNTRQNITLRITKVRARKGETRPDPRIIPVSTKFFKYVKQNIINHKAWFYSTNNYRLMLNKLGNEIGLKNYIEFSSHNMRKTFGTWMLAIGIDGFKLAQHLGHDAETLRRSYASPDIFNSEDKDRMREILNDLPNRLRS